MSIESILAMRTEVRERAAEIEENRALPRDLFERFALVGAFRLLVPAELGGGGAPITDVYRVTRELAEADASTGWVIGQGAAAAGAISVRLSAEFVAEAFSDPLANFAASGHPAGVVRIERDHVVVSGRWPFGTGAPHATWFGGLGMVPGPAAGPVPTIFYVPAADVEVHDNWDTLGMRGTGSNDFSFHEQRVAPSRTAVLFEGAPLRTDLTLGRLVKGPWYIALAASAVLVGAARRAMAEVETILASDKRLFLSATTHRESAVVQRSFANAEAALDAVDLHAEAALDRMWEIAECGRRPTPRERAKARAVLSNTAQVAAGVVDQMGDLASGNAIWRGSALERCLRDARTHRMHASIYPPTFERSGAIRLGIVEDDPLV